jgi:hypothetical protein
MNEIFKKKRIKILNLIKSIYLMIIYSLYILLDLKALPPLKAYSIYYNWELKNIKGFPCKLIHPRGDHN